MPSLPRALLVLTLAAAPADALAQSVERVSVDSAISIDTFRGQNAIHRPNVIVDVTMSARLGRGWTAYIRPWLRQPRTPSWDKEIYQAALQYTHIGTIATRVDLGYLVSPIGLGMLDTRPDANPTIMPHLSYLVPLPAFDPGAPVVQPIASTYPLGAQVTSSTVTWDARVAVLASPPNRVYVINRDGAKPPARPVLVAGGGITPHVGLRLGAAFSLGTYVKGEELTQPSRDRQLRMVTVEGEYAVGRTKLSGEVTRDTLETAVRTETAYAWFLQGMRTLAPRWYVAARQEGTRGPAATASGMTAPRKNMYVAEATVGYRLSPELTLRGSFVRRRGFQRATWDQQGGMSLVWAHRWW